MDNNLVKYPRTPHLPWSPGRTSDDRVLTNLDHFVGAEVVVTEKMDGENTTMYPHNVHARSLDSRGGADRDWVKAHWATFRHLIPSGWRICGENLWARHSLAYDNLESFFYGFSAWQGNQCLSWDETLMFFEDLGVTPVPVLYRGIWNESAIRQLSSSLDTSRREGFVVRLAGGFLYEDFPKSVAKFVRANHVQTVDKHWRNCALVPNSLGVNP